MNPRINQLVRSLLQKDSLEQCSLPELEQFAERHPYFGAAQLLLTKKMQTDYPEKYDEQLQKTFLFFHNPLWVEHMLNETGNAEIIKVKKEEAPPASIITETTPVSAGPVSVEIPAQVETGIDSPVQKEVMPPADTPETVTTEPETSEPVLSIQTFQIEPVNNSKQELLFEPFHTVDYFASQGIKFKEEDKPNDTFSQQLKSFTEWLKTLKKLPAAAVPNPASPVLEQKVEEMAEKSIRDRDVLTESMAEVWEKQGNTAKAIEIYSKLSLLEPSKSTYFATKIEDLKKQH